MNRKAKGTARNPSSVGNLQVEHLHYFDKTDYMGEYECRSLQAQQAVLRSEGEQWFFHSHKLLDPLKRLLLLLFLYDGDGKYWFGSRTRLGELWLAGLVGEDGLGVWEYRNAQGVEMWCGGMH